MTFIFKKKNNLKKKSIGKKINIDRMLQVTFNEASKKIFCAELTLNLFFIQCIHIYRLSHLYTGSVMRCSQFCIYTSLVVVGYHPSTQYYCHHRWSHRRWLRGTTVLEKCRNNSIVNQKSTLIHPYLGNTFLSWAHDVIDILFILPCKW